MILLPLLAEVYEVLRIERSDAVEEQMDLLGGGTEALDALLRRYRISRDFQVPAEDRDLELVSWLVATVGPKLRISEPQFEALVADRLGESESFALVLPRWVLSRPIDGALYQRLPCDPLVDGDDNALIQAYRGLLAQLSYLGQRSDRARAPEVMHSALPWRVVAIADHLEPDPDSVERRKGMGYRIGLLRDRTLRSGATAFEKQWWRRLDQNLVARRNVLTHLVETSGYTFESCVAMPWDHHDALEATSGIAMAVLDSIGRDLRNGEPPRAQFLSVLRATEWLDEYGPSEL